MKRGVDNDSQDKGKLDVVKFSKVESGEEIPSDPADVVSEADPFPILRFPKGVSDLMLSFLSPQAASSVSRSCRSLNTMASQHGLWWLFIKQHFPHPSAQLRKQFEKNPKALFIQQYQCLINLLNASNLNLPQSNNIVYILDALRGHVPDRKSKPGERSNFLQILFSLAGANGHLPSAVDCELLNTLKVFLGNHAMVNYKRTTIGRELLMGTAASGNLLPGQAKDNFDVKWLNQLENLRIFDIRDALLLAVKCGHIEFVQSFLFEGNPVPSLCKREAAIMAAQVGHRYILQEFLKNVGKWLDKGDIAIFFSEAIVHEQSEIVEYLLAHHDDKIPAETKAFAMLTAQQRVTSGSGPGFNQRHNAGIANTLCYMSAQRAQQLRGVPAPAPPAPMLLNQYDPEEEETSSYDSSHEEPVRSSLKKRRK